MTNPILPTPWEFYAQLNQHDWYYHYSDDHRVYQRGCDAEGRLRTIASKDPKLKELYDGFKAHYFSGDGFGSEKAPKPKMPSKED